ncbi:MAG: sugar ABC transporter permease [Clostridia bacterium]|nr:sugar ABC transporter permease [Clostridia bacterium]
MKKDSTSKNSFRAKYIRDTIFAVAILILPIAWWAFSFFYTTTDTILLAFKKLVPETTDEYVWCGLDNFKKVIAEMTSSGNVLNTSFKNSFLIWGINLVFRLPLSVLISYAIYKKVAGTGAFKVILFLPSIVSSMVWVIIFQYLVEYGVPTIKGIGPLEMPSLLKQEPSDFILMLVYTEWLGLAANMIIYTGAMSRVPPSLVEAGQLDGLTDFKELIYIVLPLIFPTLSVVLTTIVIGIFTSSLPTYQFYGNGTPDHLYTFGYYMFIMAFENSHAVNRPLVSALSVIVCCLATPITLLTRWLLEKFGPTVEY